MHVCPGKECTHVDDHCSVVCGVYVLCVLYFFGISTTWLSRTQGRHRCRWLRAGNLARSVCSPCCKRRMPACQGVACCVYEPGHSAQQDNLTCVCIHARSAWRPALRPFADFLGADPCDALAMGVSLRVCGCDCYLACAAGGAAVGRSFLRVHVP